MKLKLKNNTIIPLDDFFINGFRAYTRVASMEAYQELLTKLTPEAVEDMAIVQDDNRVLVEFTNVKLTSTQTTNLYNGSAMEIYVTLWFTGELYDETKEIMKIINGESQ